GVGQKTAIKLLKQFETVENLYNHVDEISGKKLKEKIENNKDAAFMSKELVTINQDSPVEINVDQTDYEGYKNDKVRDIFIDLGFQSLLNKIDGAVEEEENTTSLTEIEWKEIDTISEDLFTGEDFLYVEILDENYHTE